MYNFLGWYNVTWIWSKPHDNLREVVFDLWLNTVCRCFFDIVTKRLYVTDINMVPVTDSKPGSLNIHTQNLEMKAVHPNISRNVAMTMKRMLSSAQTSKFSLTSSLIILLTRLYDEQFFLDSFPWRASFFLDNFYAAAWIKYVNENSLVSVPCCTYTRACFLVEKLVRLA